MSTVYVKSVVFVCGVLVPVFPVPPVVVVPGVPVVPPPVGVPVPLVVVEVPVLVPPVPPVVVGALAGAVATWPVGANGSRALKSWSFEATGPACGLLWTTGAADAVVAGGGGGADSFLVPFAITIGTAMIAAS